MGLNAKVGSFNVSTSAVNTTQDINVGFDMTVGGEKQLVLFWWGGQTSATDAQAEQDIRAGFGGVSSTTSRRCSAVQSDHGNAVTTCHNVDRNDCMVAMISTAGASAGKLDLSTFLSTGFRTIIDE